MRKLLIATILFAGCATARDAATLALYAAQHKVLMFVMAPCQPGGMVSAWVRERDMGRMVVACETGCVKCRLVRMR